MSKNHKIINMFAIFCVLVLPDAYAVTFKDSDTNTPNSVYPSSIAGMQWESFLRREPGRQWAEKIIARPMERPLNDDGPVETQFRLVFSVLVPKDWVVTDELTKIHTFHPSVAGSNIYRIYIKGDQYFFLSAGHRYFAPIKFGVEQTFYVNCRMAYRNSNPKGWVEVFLDQKPIGSSEPLAGQFVPRHTVSMPDGDVNPYLEIGLDTVLGMPEEVEFRRLFWSLKYVVY